MAGLSALAISMRNKDTLMASYLLEDCKANPESTNNVSLWKWAISSSQILFKCLDWLFLSFTTYRMVKQSCSEQSSRTLSMVYKCFIEKVRTLMLKTQRDGHLSWWLHTKDILRSVSTSSINAMQTSAFVTSTERELLTEPRQTRFSICSQVQRSPSDYLKARNLCNLSSLLGLPGAQSISWSGIMVRPNLSKLTNLLLIA